MLLSASSEDEFSILARSSNNALKTRSMPHMYSMDPVTALSSTSSSAGPSVSQIKRLRAGSISGRLRAASDLADVGAIDQIQKGVIKDLIIAGDTALQAALDTFERGGRTGSDIAEIQGLIKRAIEGRKQSIDILDGLDFDFLNPGGSDEYDCDIGFDIFDYGRTQGSSTSLSSGGNANSLTSSTSFKPFNDQQQHSHIADRDDKEDSNYKDSNENGYSSSSPYSLGYDSSSSNAHGSSRSGSEGSTLSNDGIVDMSAYTAVALSAAALSRKSQGSLKMKVKREKGTASAAQRRKEEYIANNDSSFLSMNAIEETESSSNSKDILSSSLPSSLHPRDRQRTLSSDLGLGLFVEEFGHFDDFGLDFGNDLGVFSSQNLFSTMSQSNNSGINGTIAMPFASLTNVANRHHSFEIDSDGENIASYSNNSIVDAVGDIALGSITSSENTSSSSRQQNSSSLKTKAGSYSGSYNSGNVRNLFAGIVNSKAGLQASQLSTSSCVDGTPNNEPMSKGSSFLSGDQLSLHSPVASSIHYSNSTQAANLLIPNHFSVSGAGGGSFVGVYSPEARKLRIEKFLEKRSKRVWCKKVKYDVRKNFADSRVRVKGRFVKKQDEEFLLRAGP